MHLSRLDVPQPRHARRKPGSHSALFFARRAIYWWGCFLKTVPLPFIPGGGGGLVFFNCNNNPFLGKLPHHGTRSVIFFSQDMGTSQHKKDGTSRSESSGGLRRLEVVRSAHRNKISPYHAIRVALLGSWLRGTDRTPRTAKRRRCATFKHQGGYRNVPVKLP